MTQVHRRRASEETSRREAGPQDFRPVVASGRTGARRRRHLSTASTPTAATTPGRPSSSSPAGSRSTRWICAAAASRTASASTSRRSRTTSSDVRSARDAGEVAGAGPARVPARSQRRRRRLVRLHARASGRARRVDLRELRLPGAGAGFRPRGRQGAEPPRAARARAAAQERGVLARSQSGPGDERRSADRARGPADQDRRRAGPRRRAARRGSFRSSRCRCSSSTARPTRSRGRAAASSSTTPPAPRTRR